MNITKITVNLIEKLQKYSGTDTMLAEDFMSMSSIIFSARFYEKDRAVFLYSGKGIPPAEERSAGGIPGKKMKSLYVK